MSDISVTITLRFSSVKGFLFFLYLVFPLLYKGLVSRTLLSILIDLNNAAVRIVSTRRLISKFSNPSINHLVTIRTTPFTIGLPQLFLFPSNIKVFIFLFIFFQVNSLVFSSLIRQVLFVMTITRYGHLHSSGLSYT